MYYFLYAIGNGLIIGGIAWGLVLAGVGKTKVMIVVMILTGIAILKAVRHLRSRD